MMAGHDEGIMLIRVKEKAREQFKRYHGLSLQESGVESKERSRRVADV